MFLICVLKVWDLECNPCTLSEVASLADEGQDYSKHRSRPPSWDVWFGRNLVYCPFLYARCGGASYCKGSWHEWAAFASICMLDKTTYLKAGWSTSGRLLSFWILHVWIAASLTSVSYLVDLCAQPALSIPVPTYPNSTYHLCFQPTCNLPMLYCSNSQWL
jgi:hypothetical protein